MIVHTYIRMHIEDGYAFLIIAIWFAFLLSWPRPWY